MRHTLREDTKMAELHSNLRIIKSEIDGNNIVLTLELRVPKTLCDAQDIEFSLANAERLREGFNSLSEHLAQQTMCHARETCKPPEWLVNERMCAVNKVHHPRM